MATQLYSLPQFFGMKYGTADNLIPTGYASEAKNVDVTDGALQTLVGGVPYPTAFDDDGSFPFNPDLLWEATEDYAYYISNKKILRVYADQTESGDITRAEVIYDPYTDASSAEVAAQEQHMLGCIQRLFVTYINGERVVIGLRDDYNTEEVTGLIDGPILIRWEPDTEHDGFTISYFGTGMFLTSDAITAVITDADSLVTGVTIGRVMTAAEQARCLYAGVYLMEHENDILDYTAAYVSDITVTASTSTLTFLDPLAAGSVQTGYYVKVRGGLSNQPVSFMTTFFGRLFAGGDQNFPNRLYWSCLPGDGRTIEDWTADDASPDTGGGYVQVGDEGYISALFVYQSQLLIWKGDELWRLYGATPSQYTLELVYRGAGKHRSIEAVELSKYSERVMQNRIADAHGVFFVLLDEGLFYYNGSSLARVDNDRTLLDFLQDRSSISIDSRGVNFSKELSNVNSVCYWHDALYFVLNNYGDLVKFDIQTGSLITYSFQGRAISTRNGVMVAWAGFVARDLDQGYIIVDGVSMDDKALYDLPYDAWIGPRNWEDVFHYCGTYNGNKLPLNAVWESRDLSFGASSYHKRLRRIGLDVTGPIKVVVKNAEGGVWQTELVPTDIRARRLEWIMVDMPYESSFRIRFESVDGNPFRIHNGVDFYIDLNTRN